MAWCGRSCRSAYRPETYLPFGVPGSGLIVAVIGLTLLGFLTANLIGRTLVDLGERLLGPHSGGARDLSRPQAGVRNAVFGQGLEPAPGRPGRISRAGHVVDRADLAAAERRGGERLPGQEEHISVFLPCAPNPTTGFFFYVPKSKIIEIDMSAEDAATLIMSAGVVQPGSDQQKKVAALANMANAAQIANSETPSSSSLQPEPAKVE